MKRQFETLTNEELSQIFKMRCRKLEKWLAQHTWSKTEVNTTKQVYYRESKLYSLLVMECLIELEARAIPNGKWDKPYLAELFNGV